MLISLVGQGVMSQVKTNELDELVEFTRNIAKYPISTNMTNDIVGL